MNTRLRGTIFAAAAVAVLALAPQAFADHKSTETGPFQDGLGGTLVPDGTISANPSCFELDPTFLLSVKLSFGGGKESINVTGTDGVFTINADLSPNGIDDSVEIAPKEGIDAVIVKCGGASRVIRHADLLDATGAIVCPSTTTATLSHAVWCSDGVIAPVTIDGGPFCNLSDATVTDFCAALGPLAVVTIGVPGNAGSQTCVCSGVTADICNSAPIGDDSLVCDPTDGICNPDCATGLENCCFISPFCPADNSAENPGDDTSTRRDCPIMDLSALPAGLLSIQTIGSCCTITDDPLAGGGGISGGRFCYENFGFACAPGFELQ